MNIFACFYFRAARLEREKRENKCRAKISTFTVHLILMNSKQKTNEHDDDMAHQYFCVLEIHSRHNDDDDDTIIQETTQDIPMYRVCTHEGNLQDVKVKLSDIASSRACGSDCPSTKGFCPKKLGRSKYLMVTFFCGYLKAITKISKKILTLFKIS